MKHLLLLNIYMPPHKKPPKLIMLNELKKVILSTKSKFPNDHLIVCGDFNMQGIKWAHNKDIPGTLSSNTDGLSNVDKLFL